MVSTPEECTYDSPIIPNQSERTQNPSERKWIRQFSEALDVKHKTSVCGLGAAKSKRKSIKTGNVLWSSIAKFRQNFKESLYSYILHHPQVAQYPIENYCLYVSISSNSKE